MPLGREQHLDVNNTTRGCHRAIRLNRGYGSGEDLLGVHLDFILSERLSRFLLLFKYSVSSTLLSIVLLVHFKLYSTNSTRVRCFT